MVYIQGIFSEGRVYNLAERSELYMCTKKFHDGPLESESGYTGYRINLVKLNFNRLEPGNIDAIEFGWEYSGEMVYMDADTRPPSEYAYLIPEGTTRLFRLSSLNDILFPAGDILMYRYSGQNGTKLCGNAEAPKQSKRIRPTGDIDI